MERACELNGMDLMGRPLYIDAATAGRLPVTEPGKPVEGCWFCLSNPNADTDLVVSIGKQQAVTVESRTFRYA